MKKYILLMLCLLFAAGIRAQGNFEQGKQYYTWRDYKRALPYLQAAAKEGYGEACYLLGEMYYYGLGTEKNYTIAARMYGRATEFGYDQGEAELGRMYEKGDGFQEDPQKAFSLYTKSYRRGNLLGTYLLARCYFHGIGTEEDNDKAVFMFDSLYNNAELRDQYKWIYCYTCSYLGHCYKNGWGTSVDLKKAVRCYVQSEDGDWLYTAAQLVRDHKLHDWKVKDLLREACEKGTQKPNAYYEYGKMLIDENYFSGAVAYLEKGAEMGHPGAMQLLGDCYQEGKGVPANLMKAREWHAKAEANGVEEWQEEQRIEAAIRAAREQEEKDRIAAEKRAAEEQAAAKRRDAKLAALARYKEGDLYQEGGEKGVVIRRGSDGVLIIALSSFFGSWPGYRASGEGWRLPTREELSYIHSNRALVNQYLAAYGGTQIRSGVYYWTSESSVPSNLKVASNGSEIYRDQSNKNYICLVREY